MVANPARCQLNRENNISLSPFAPGNLVSRDEFDRPVPRQPANSPQPGRIWCLVGLPSLLPLSETAFIYAVNRHRVSPELIGSRICVSMAFTGESPPAQGQ